MRLCAGRRTGPAERRSALGRERSRAARTALALAAALLLAIPGGPGGAQEPEPPAPLPAPLEGREGEGRDEEGGDAAAGPQSQDAQTSERAAFRDFLFELLRAAETRGAADQAEADIWDFWFEGPDDAATRRLAEARRLLAARAFGAAEDRLGELIGDFPDWAEPYNQRAILFFLLEAYDASLADIDRTLRREPRHFGALSGSAQIYIAQGRFEQAAEALRKAQEIHPWIGGRTPPGVVEGQDL